MPTRNLNNKERLELINDFENSVYDNCQIRGFYHVGRSSIYRCVSNKDAILQAIENGQGKRARIEKKQNIIDHDRLVKEFILMCQTKGLAITTRVIIEFAKQKAQEMGRNDLNCSNGWFDRFKKRTNLKLGKVTGESKSVSLEKVKLWKENVIPSIVINWQSEFIYNCDETALFWRQAPNRSYFIKKHEHRGDKVYNERVSLLFCVNMNGDKETPLVIGKAAKPRCSYAGWLNDVAVDYKNQTNAWMDSALFDKWLSEWHQSLVSQEKKVLLLLDNFSGHKVDFDKFSNITFKFLPSGTTSHTQPLDSGIIRSFKSKYLSLMINNLIENIKIGKLSQIVSNINIKNAIGWIDLAWQEVSSQTIRNCWSHAGYINLDIDIEHDYEMELNNAIQRFSEISLNTCSSKVYVEQVTFDYEPYYCDE